MRKKEINVLARNRDTENQDWRNEHGQPNFEFLDSLAKENSPNSLEKLRSIAEDLNVSYNTNSSNAEIIDEILASVRSDPTVTS